MKTKLLFGVLAAAALASCNNDDVVKVNNGKGIFFRTSLDNPVTRANTISQSNLDVFYVTAVGSEPVLMTHNGVRSTDGGNTWNCDRVYFWPDYRVRFFAYSHLDTTLVKIDNVSQKILGFEPAHTVSGQKDLVVSYNSGTRKANEAGGVAMNFKHALSQIEFRAKCSNSNIKINVRGVKLANVATKGDFTFPDEVTDASYVLRQEKWDNLKGGDAPSRAYVIRGDEFSLTGDAKSLMFGNDNFMLLPQKQHKWNATRDTTGVYISVLCQIFNVDGDNKTQLFPKTAGLFGFAAVPVEIDWQPGKKYIYTLDFCNEGGGAGKPDPDPQDPTNPKDPLIDPDPAVPGKDILGKPIRFTVTVEEWGEEDSDIRM